MSGPRAGAARTPGEVVADAALAQTVAALRDEIRGLRAAAQLRAVIEQAKGVLVERHHITLDEAFVRLRAMSQEHNVRLVEVAATVVGVAVPVVADGGPEFPEDVLRSRMPSSPAASGAWSALQKQPDVRAGVLTALLDSVAGAASQGDEAAQLLLDLLGPHGVAALTIYRAAVDGSLRIVGQVGVPGDLMSSWRSIPPSRDIPYVRCLMDDRAYFWGSRDARAVDFPAVASSASSFEATATVPVRDGDAVIGVVGLMWSAAQEFDDERTGSITRTVERVAPLLLRHVAAADPELEWLNALLRLHLDPWLLLETIPSSEGVIRDFVVQDMSPLLREGGPWLGRRILELWPFLAEDGLAHALTGLVRAGGSWTMTVGIGTEAPWGIPGSRVRAVRLGRRVVIVWRPGPA